MNPSDFEYAETAAMRLGCSVNELRVWPAPGIEGGFFFSSGDIFGASRILIDKGGQQLWRPSAVSETKHIEQFVAGQRN